MGKSIVITLVVGLLCAGCGGVSRTGVQDKQDSTSYNRPLPTGPFVQLTSVSHRKVKVDPDLLPQVLRYVADQAVVALEDKRNYRMVLSSELALQFGEPGNPSAPKALPDARARVEILELKEKMGATVKVGFVSKQKKYAQARVRITLERPGKKSVRADGRGRSEVGAWGMLASVQRSAMKNDRGVWKMDDSMLGLACRDALKEAARKLPRSW